MVEPNEIVSALLEIPDRLRLQSLAGAKVVITAGPTREAIDPVRYITNRSSGKMGFAVAVAARDAGADVVLVSGPVALPTPAGVRRVDVETAEQMYERVHAEIANTDLFIGCAAVSDYRPQRLARQKIKRSSQELELALVRSPDTLASSLQLVLDRLEDLGLGLVRGPGERDGRDPDQTEDARQAHARHRTGDGRSCDAFQDACAQGRCIQDTVADEENVGDGGLADFTREIGHQHFISAGGDGFAQAENVVEIVAGFPLRVECRGMIPAQHFGEGQLHAASDFVGRRCF